MVLPAVTPVTSPVFETVAMPVFAISQFTTLVTFSALALSARTTVAEYCEVAPTDGGDPEIEKDVTVEDGRAGVPAQDVVSAAKTIALMRHATRTSRIALR